MITQIGFDPGVYESVSSTSLYSNLSSSVGDWFNNFWASLKAGDFGAIALTGVAIIMLVQVVETIRG